jgi:hypothetical protein
MTPLLTGVFASQISGRLTVPDSGAMFPIAMVNVGSAGSSTISFTSIPQTYKHLQIRGIARSTINDTRDDVLMRINSDTGNNYAGHQINGDGSSASAGTLGGTPPVNNLYPVYVTGSTATSSVFGATVIDILDYTNTNKNKVIRCLSGVDVNGSGNMLFRSGLWLNTNAITTITFSMSNFAQYSQFALYGIKG